MKKGYAKIVLPIVAMAVIFVGASVNAASRRKDAYIEFTTDSALTITLSSDDVSIDNLIPGTADVSNEISVTVSTNSETGYTLNAVGGTTENATTNLVHVDTSIEDTFSSITPGVSVNAITEDRTWGFSTDHGATYSGMPIFYTDTPAVINVTSDPSMDEIPFLIGARANKFQAPGEYRNIVTFTATTNPVPNTIATTRYMQDINDDVYASMEMEKQYQLIDRRDNKKYWVAKLQDGNVWMTQNLNFELYPGIVLYPDTSNTNTPIALNVSSERVDAKLGVTGFDGSNFWSYYNEFFPSNVDPDTYIPGGTLKGDSGLIGPDYYLESTEDLDADSENWHYAVGGRYSTYGTNLSEQTKAICPKGWSLPTYSESESDLISMRQYDIKKLIEYYPQMGVAPAYISVTPYESNVRFVDGYEWPNTMNSAKYAIDPGTGWSGAIYLVTDNYNSGYDDGNLHTWSPNTGNSYNNFVSIRCVARRSSVYPFTYYLNFGTDPDIQYYYYEPASWGGADASIRAIEMGDDVGIPFGKVRFLGWATTPDATEPEYQPGDIIVTNTDTANDLYAVWEPATTSFDDAFAAAGKTKVGDYYAMQDMTQSICSAVSINSVTELVDTRDGSIYTVAKLRRTKSGDIATCWMIENLSLGKQDVEYTLTPADTDVYQNFTLPALSTGISSLDTPQFNVVSGADNFGGNAGNEYNYYATTAGTDDPRMASICPKGWKIPGSGSTEGNESGYYSFYELTRAYNNISQYKTFDLYYGTTWTSGYYKVTNPDSWDYNYEYIIMASGERIAYPSSQFAKIRCVVKPRNESGSAPTAKAILGSNNNLNFVYDNNSYLVGDTYTDNVGETQITKVYNVPLMTSESNLPGWYNEVSGMTINISSSFHDFEPISTAYWFADIYDYGSITGLANINTSRTINMSSMFKGFMNGGTSENNYTWTLSGIENWDVSNVTDMSSMFRGSGFSWGNNNGTWSLDLHNWNVGNVLNMANMFDDTGGSNYQTRTWSLNVSGWDTSKVQNMSFMFARSAPNSETWSLTGINGWNVGSVRDMSYMFYYAAQVTSWTSIDLSGWDVGSVINMTSMFNGACRGSGPWRIGNIGSWDVSNVTNMDWMFYEAGRSASDWYIGDISGWDVSSVASHVDFISLNAYHTNNITQPNWP